jgi:hypothetical protein
VEEKLAKAEAAFEKERLFEARKWAGEVLADHPGNLQGQRLMAKIIEKETLAEKSVPGEALPEELGAEEKALAVKTWLERSQGFLQVNRLEEALQAAEQVFLLDPGNLEASRLVDEIKNRSREQGKEDSAFLQSLYQEEVERRIMRYTEEAQTSLDSRRFASARLAIEKILLLDPENREGERLLRALEQAEKAP